MPIFSRLDIKKLSGVEIDIYKYIINNMDKVIFMRIREIASNANVSPTSVHRFINKVGFSSFPEFKLFLKEEIKQQNVVVHNLGLINIIDNIHMNIFHPDIEYQLKNIAKKIIDSDSIVFLGVGASGSIAEYAARKFANLDYFSVCIKELTYPLSSILKNNKQNLVFCLSVSGSTNELVETIAGIENKKSVYTCCITGTKNSKVGNLCDYSIEYAINQERKNIFLDLSSQVPAMLIIESIFDYVYDYRIKSIKEILE